MRTLLLLLGLSACAPVSVTMMEPAWDPLQREPYRRVLVIGVGDPAIEPAMARRIRGTGAEVVLSSKLDEGEDMPSAVAASGADAVLVTRLVSTGRSYRYDEGATFTSLAMDPVYEGSGFGEALPLRSQGAVFPWVRESVTLGEGWTEQTEVIVESTLFRVADGVPTWHARFSALAPRAVERSRRAVAKEAVAGIRRVGQLPLPSYGP